MFEVLAPGVDISKICLWCGHMKREIEPGVWECNCKKYSDKPRFAIELKKCLVGAQYLNEIDEELK